MIVKVIRVVLTADLEDPLSNGFRSGLDQSTLKFEFNGTVIATSALTIQPTNETIDGQQIPVRFVITYSPSATELTLPGTNTLKVDIANRVGNKMTQVVHTFQLPPP